MAVKRKRIIRKLALCGVICITVSGCAETIIAGLTIMDLFTAGSITSSLMTGKGLGEHAMDAITGQDCRILDAVFREDRAICEPKDSIATQGDFKGLIALLDTPAGANVQLADLPLDSSQFPTINSRAAANSPKILGLLNRHNIVKINNQDMVADTRHMHLLKATSEFTVAQQTATPVNSNELRKRLTGSDLF